MKPITPEHFRPKAAMKFEDWLAMLLGQKKGEVRRLLQHQISLRFLIAWSLFESKCFRGFLKETDLEKFSRRIVSKESFNVSLIAESAKHFHSRYQDNRHYKNLLHKGSSAEMSRLLHQPFDLLKPQEKVFLAAFTVYRYRNNIFHGNKGVASWLQFKQQIDCCIGVMQAFVNHAESMTSTFTFEPAI